MNYAKVTPADLRSDAEKLYARADALEQGLKFFEGKVCELCGGNETTYAQLAVRKHSRAYRQFIIGREPTGKENRPT